VILLSNKVILLVKKIRKSYQKYFLNHLLNAFSFGTIKIYSTAFLLSMLRCIFIFDRDPKVRDDMSIIFVKILYKKYLKV
jgi:hypothetical protein